MSDKVSPIRYQWKDDVNIYGNNYDSVHEDRYKIGKRNVISLFKSPDDSIETSLKTEIKRGKADCNYEELIELYGKMAFLHPENAENYVSLADCYFDHKEYDNAINIYKKIHKANDYKDIESVIAKEADCLIKLNRLSEAMKAITSYQKYDKSETLTAIRNKLIKLGIKDSQLIEEAKNILDGLLEDIEFDYILPEDDQKIFDEESTEKYIIGLLNYCDNQYNSLEDKDYWSKCILTAFYSAICLALFCKSDKENVLHETAYNYINSRIDLENADMQAEKMLNTKEGEEKADYIWGIISEYISGSEEIFDMFGTIDEDVFNYALKISFNVGIMVALKYIQEEEKKKKTSANNQKNDNNHIDGKEGSHVTEKQIDIQKKESDKKPEGSNGSSKSSDNINKGETAQMPVQKKAETVKPAEHAVKKENAEKRADATTKVRFCRKCGTKLIDGASFCKKCGTKII